MDYDKLKNEKGLRASMLQEANGELLRELEKYSAQLKDTLKENGELKTLYLQVYYYYEYYPRKNVVLIVILCKNTIKFLSLNVFEWRPNLTKVHKKKISTH